jgi:hypothetical protein
MTEDVKDVQPTDVPGAAGTAMPDVPSGSSADVSSQQIGPDVGKEFLDRLAAVEASVTDQALDDRVDARVKSDKDIRFNRVTDEIHNLREIVEAAGGDFSKVEGTITINELMHRIDVLESGSGVAPGGGELSEEWTTAQVETDVILMSAGWAPDDPRYEDFKNKYRGRVSPDKWPRMVETFVDKIGKQGSSSPAAVTVEGSGLPPSSDSDATLEKQYQERLAELRQGDVRGIANLKLEFRKKGLAKW